jgi:hypothetical protein
MTKQWLKMYKKIIRAYDKQLYKFKYSIHASVDDLLYLIGGWDRVMVFNDTFNNISVISCQPVL